jgi:predicted outer membrane repeat protein
MSSVLIAVALAACMGVPKSMHTWGALQTDLSVLRPGAVVQYLLVSGFHSIDPSDFIVANIPALANVTITTQDSMLVIDAFHNDQFFNVDGHLSLSGVVLKNGQSDVGGAIAITANASAIFTNVVFANNSANQGGGALFVDGNATCFQCSFTSNSARDGGAVYTRGRTVFSHSTFEDNKATGNGGGAVAVLPYGRSYYTNTSFTDNIAHYPGGSLYVFGYAKVVSCSFLVSAGKSASAGHGDVFIGSDDVAPGIAEFACPKGAVGPSVNVSASEMLVSQLMPATTVVTCK